MKTLFGFFSLIFIIFILANLKRPLPEGLAVSKQLTPFSRLAAGLYSKIAHAKRSGIFRNLLISDKANENLLRLNPALDQSLLQEKYYIEKLTNALLLIFAAFVFAFLMSISEESSSILLEGQKLLRNWYGEGAKTANFTVVNENGAAVIEDLSIEIGEIRYSDEQINYLADKLLAQLPELVKSNNESLDTVRSNLNLNSKVDGYPFSIEWESENYSLIDGAGKLGDITQADAGSIVKLTATLKYFEKLWISDVYARVYPPIKTPIQKFAELVEEKVVQNDAQQAQEEYLTLPGEAEGIKLIWRESKDEMAPVIFFLLAGAGILIYVLKDNELKNGTDKRARQLLFDYPEMISKLTVLMGAGMTVRGAFMKLANDYQNRARRAGQKRFVYEEISLMCREMDGGIAETKAYDNFAARCNLQRYYKFCAVLNQNLRKGSLGVLPLLKAEAKDSFEERKAIAKRLGEEAGTKLLGPMMLMLLVVLVILIFPAIMSFGI